MPASAPHDRVLEIARTQNGFFSAHQAAHAAGLSRTALRYQADPDTVSGRYEKHPAYRGVYRLRGWPETPWDEITAAWLAVGIRDRPVVSHQTALILRGLTDLMPDEVHLTLPRSARSARALAGVRIHHTTRNLDDATPVHGLPTTPLARSIVDAIEAGMGIEQAERAVRTALAGHTEDGQPVELLTPQRLRRAADGRGVVVRSAVERCLEAAP
jgi:predicted transcriptional regulator of viral defense system